MLRVSAMPAFGRSMYEFYLVFNWLRHFRNRLPSFPRALLLRLLSQRRPRFLVRVHARPFQVSILIE
jgi:hypothetical protein